MAASSDERGVPVNDAVLAAARDYVQEFFAHEASGHDAHHTMRVYRTALRIAADEGADANVVALAALLHDVDDAKISPQTADDLGNARAFLAKQGIDGAAAEHILVAIREVSFSKNGGAPP